MAPALPHAVKLLIACSGIFASFSYFAVLQEDVYKKKYGEQGEKFSATLLAIFVERAINAVLALICMLVLGRSGVQIAFMDIFNSGVSQMLAMAASNESLRYVSMPTQILGKSCKMVPVMIGGIVLGGKKYTAGEYLTVFTITAGVVIFNFGGQEKKGGATDSTYGMLLIFASLVFDAVTSGLQDSAKAKTKKLNPGIEKAEPTMFESMFYTNLSGSVVALALGAVAGQIGQGIGFCSAHPEVMTAILFYSLASAMGQLFIYYTIAEFGPLLLATVTTTRKVFSTLYSIFRDPTNKLSMQQWSGCAAVFVGIAFEVLLKSQHKPKKEATKKA
jgi:UDP-galactose transporter B1